MKIGGFSIKTIDLNFYKWYYICTEFYGPLAQLVRATGS